MKTKLLIGMGVGGICLWLALRGVSWGEVWISLKNLSLLPLLLIFLMMFLTHVFRVRRWSILLKPILPLPFKELFAINAVGFLAILSFPFRLGELVRPLLLKRRHQIPLTTGFATIAVERTFDGLVTASILAIGLLSAPQSEIQVSSFSFNIRNLVFLSLSIFLTVFLLLLLTILQKDRTFRFLEWFLQPFPPKFRQMILDGFHNFSFGVQCLPSFLGLFRILAESCGVWGVMVIAMWLCFQAFDLPLSWGAACGVLGISAVGITVPGPPGFVGTYQLFVQAALVLYGCDRSTGLAFSLIMYSVNLFYIVGMGSFFFQFMATPFRTLYVDVAQEKTIQHEKRI